MNIKYKIKFKIPKQIHLEMLEDLKKKHSFAYERVGFLFTTSKLLSDNTLLILAKDYVPVDDADYIEDNTVGAKINGTAIRKTMQRLFDQKEGCFHVHLHSHTGTPSPSFIDKESLPLIIESFLNISSNQPSGVLILSEDSFYSSIKYANETRFITPEMISVIGYPLSFLFPMTKKSIRKKTLERQSFLGTLSQLYFENIKVGIVGYGGGGSHIGQQLAHLGIRNVLVFDNDKIEETNLNRLIGAWFKDIKDNILKTSIAKRVINKINPTANVNCIESRWQDNADLLQSCDVVFGCIDSYIARKELEAECRRYLIPYIDIGMDVHKLKDASSAISGQIILSMPGAPCLSCLGFLTEQKMVIEAAKYGNVGGNPQVVWANGVLASTAVGIFVDLITGWSKTTDKLFYLSYDGNLGKLDDHPRLKFCPQNCTHFPLTQIGKPIFTNL